MAQWWEHSPPNNVARVQIPASTPYVGVEFVVGSLPCSERFSLNTAVFPCPQKPTFSNSNSTRNRLDKEQLCGCATSKSLYILIYYYIYLFLNLWSRLDFCRSLFPPPTRDCSREERGLIFRTAADNRAYLWSTVKIVLWTVFSDQWLLSDVVNIWTTPDFR